MGKKRWSIIWKLPLDEMKDLIAKSKSYAEVLRFFGLPNRGNNFRTLKKRIEEDGIDDSHILNNKSLYVGLTKKSIRPIDELLIKNSSAKNKDIKSRLIRLGLLDEVCKECGLGNIWNGKPIVLQLDHIDGDPTNNTIENLRMLCPNCHTQTPTFGRRESKKPKKIKRAGWGSQPERRKVAWPTKEELYELLQSNTYTALGKLFGVSSTTVTAWAKGYGIHKHRGIV